MDDIDLPIPTTPPKRTGRRLHAGKESVTAEWWDGGTQSTHQVAWAEISGKTLTVSGKSVTASQIRDGMVALEAAIERLAENAGPLVEVAP